MRFLPLNLGVKKTNKKKLQENNFPLQFFWLGSKFHTPAHQVICSSLITTFYFLKKGGNKRRVGKSMENKAAYIAKAHIQNPETDQRINFFLTLRLVSETMVPPPLARDSNAACVIPLRTSLSRLG